MSNKYKIWLKITSAGYIYIGFAENEPYRTDKKCWSNTCILYNQNNSTYHPDIVQMENLLQIKYSEHYKDFIKQIENLIKCGYLNKNKIYQYGNKAEEALFIPRLYDAYCCKKLFPYFTNTETGISKNNNIKIESKPIDNMLLLL